ncbi:hypothetical protein ABUL04_26975 [Micromonospora harpali]|uniref:Uncharacterized protein n=2 Tax=Micromonospora TaxID=1873 RepID=A0A0D0X1N0_9ACTN|nr:MULTISPECIES: hypothetical protein [Micromonospora]KIR64839.1 hypothetical protein TK50_04385 [Micromonospora haikouensis]MDI5942675.1 hypothetical protein [Micromonospora sp. DH15]OON32615.1 hypothetical protein BSA16_04665 [Micromonospora sp. Rc5]
MARRQDRSKQQTAERDEQRERDAERSRDWADEAAQARTADDPRAVAPHDAAGRPSNGRQF